MAEHILSGSPSLLPIYVRAAATMPLHRDGDALPKSVYVLDDQRVDAKHLADYQQICAFPVSDALPATYLHLMVFPLSMALMSERAFPFPLVGLVHVANSITMLRPLTFDERVSLRVRSDELRAHSAGTQFDVIAEATVGGETVWTSRSTYLRRGKPSTKAEKTPRSKRELTPQAGVVANVRVPGDIGRRYGAVSGDRNPIHLHPLCAKLFGFPAAIAHGMWLEARVLATLEGRLPAAYTVDVSFKLPVLLPTTLAVATEIDSVGGWQLDVRSARSGKPHLIGTVDAMRVVT